MSDQFATFFRGLESTPGLIRFFRRSKEWLYYTCHGTDADFVGREAFKSSTVVSSQGGLPSVSISVKIFSSLVPVLLERNLRIEVWEQEPGSTTRWRLRRAASPGDVEALMADISPGDGEAQPEEDATSSMAVMMSAVATAGGGVGVAYVNTAFRTMGLLQFQDSNELADLEGVVIQVGARECLLADQGPFRKKIEEVMGRSDVLCTQKPHKFFKGGEDEIIKDLADLTGLGGVDGAASFVRGADGLSGKDSETRHLAAGRGMTLALSALRCLVRHLGLVEDSANHGTFSLVIDELRKYMHYDAAASKAMGVFPSRTRFRLAAALGHGDPGSNTSDFSLFSILNRTCTAMGSRRLKGQVVARCCNAYSWLQHPLVDLKAINQRQAMVQTLCNEKALVDTLQKGHGMLRGMPDLDKIVQRFLRKPVRVTLATLLGVYRAVMRLASVAAALSGAIDGSNTHDKSTEDLDGSLLLRKFYVSPLQQAVSDLSKFQSLCEEVIDLEHMRESGGKQIRVRQSFHEDLERLGQDLDRARSSMVEVLREVEKEAKAGAGKIKLEFSAVHSNHLRVTKKDQGLVGKCKAALTLSVQKAGVLFTTDRLRSVDARATRLKSQYEDVQSKIVDQAITVAATYAPVLSSAAKVISEIDVLVALAVCAHTWDWCRPTLLPVGSQVIKMKELRHPSVEASRGSSNFIPNDVELTHDGRLAIVTGPNMAGKSTFIRSVGIACLLAQIGSFVPAAKASMNVVDRICARVGASDNQLRGVSTFMAEMLETVAILRRVDRRSLVIVDELGRGTSTCDGFGIAWAVADRLTSSGCLCLFATHFHELTALERYDKEKDKENGVQNLHVMAEADPDSNKLTMLYKASSRCFLGVTRGSCDRSFGIHVARIANFPAHVVAEAERLAVALEKGEHL
ncbi:unnamed protein product, partial [Ascophyllum nodosum]